jgi:hypothetical protein
MNEQESGETWPLKRDLGAEIEYQASERDSQRELLEKGGISSDYLDSLDPTLKPKIIELYRQEAEELRALDPATAIIEDMRVITARFREERDSLNPNRDK